MYSKSFTGTSSTTLTAVCTLSLPAGKYFVVSEVAYDRINSRYYQQVANGSNVFIKDSGSAGGYTPVSNSAGYIELSSAGNIVLSAKLDTAGVAIDGSIKALKIE